MKRGLLLAIGSGLLVVGVLAAAGDEEPPVDVAGLPLAMREPACEAGQGVGSGDILWAEGSSFATPREALAAALGHTDPWGDAIQDFSGRFVRVGSGPNATLGREFTLEYPDGSLQVLAVASWSDGGWLVSGHSQCYTPPPNEVANAG